MFTNILLILAPLFIGYAIEIHHPKLLHYVDSMLSKMVYLILALMGYNLAFVDNLTGNLTHLLLISATFIALLTLFNLGALFLISQKRGLTHPIEPQQRQSFSPRLLKDSTLMVSIVLIGLGIGIIGQWHLPYQHQLSDYVLMVLLAFIGLQLRSSDLTLRQIFLNKRGLFIAGVVFASSLPGAMLAGYLLDIPQPLALALGSGYGWYSLSGILVTGQVDALMGSSAFFIDLFRELIAIMLIPMIMPISPTSAIGYAGATAMDFTLPIIAKSGGPHYVPIAIVSGFILSLACPAFITIWLAIGGY